MPREFTSDDRKRLAGMPTPLTDPPLYLKACIYGDAGSWKTVTCASLGNVLVLSGDPGWVSIKNHPDIWRTTTVLEFVGFRQLETLALALYHQIPPYDQYDTFLVDPTTNIQEDYVDDLLRAGRFTKGKNAVDNRPQFTIENEAAAADLGIKELPGQDDYHAAKNILRDPLVTLNRAPVNVIHIAHEREPTDLEQKKGILRVRPDMTDALYKIIFKSAHLVGRMYREEDSTYINFRGNRTQAGKSRIAILNDRRIKAEQFPKVIKQWQGTVAENWEVPDFKIEIPGGNTKSA